MKRSLVIIMALIGNSILIPTTVLGSEGTSDNEWLVGTWVRTVSRGVIHETWRRLSASVLEGGSYIINGKTGATRQDEWLLLADMDGKLQYIAKPQGNPTPTVFTLIEASADSMTFENLAHDFPQRIIYKRNGDSAMTVTIEGPAGNGETRRIDFPFARLE